ncbi:MAG: isoamylase early set domain-containing protein [Flavobacteriaceae bacterium]|nr:isoamylase early set domain-containing protein [Flavobacteriaceae bacterium]MDZ4146952.1 isoamylase early set domain-containing protein [Flavobacteriaceae bacterium]
MALKKQFLKSKPVCKVTFDLSPEQVGDAKKVSVVGDFNDWKEKKGLVLKKLKDGGFKGAIDLAVGAEYQFRYLVDGEKWINDDQADKYVNSGVSFEDNSVVSV